MTDITKYERYFINFPPTAESLDTVIENVIDYGEKMVNLVNVTYQMMRNSDYADELDDETKEQLEHYIEYVGTRSLRDLHVQFDSWHDQGHDMYNDLVAYKEENFPDTNEDLRDNNDWEHLIDLHQNQMVLGV